MIKRLFDFIASALALILLAPLLLVVALGIKLTSSGPVFYRAERVGKDERLFKLFKFRSMVERPGDAPAGPRITAAGDARITPFGSLLRRSKIDELPQLLNVLLGEMSLVGPRPEDPTYVALYTPVQRHVLSVRPGITSPASVQYRHEEALLVGTDWEKTYVEVVMPAKLEIELAYLATRSFWTDVGILWQTVRALAHSPDANTA